MCSVHFWAFGVLCLSLGVFTYFGVFQPSVDMSSTGQKTCTSQRAPQNLCKTLLVIQGQMQMKENVSSAEKARRFPNRQWCCNTTKWENHMNQIWWIGLTYGGSYSIAINIIGLLFCQCAMECRKM